MSCSVSRYSIRQGIIDTASNMLMDSGLFNRVSPRSYNALLAEAMPLGDDIKGMYKELFKMNPEQVLFEVASQYNGHVKSSSEDDTANGLLNTFPYQMIEIAQEMFPTAKMGDRFSEFSRAKISAGSNIRIDARYPRFENFHFDIYDGERFIGQVHVENDGEYLTAYKVDVGEVYVDQKLTKIPTPPNAGTHAHMQIADFARGMGLMLKSDILPSPGNKGRMSEGSIRTWERFVEAGQADRFDDVYLFTGTAKEVEQYYKGVSAIGSDVFEPKDPKGTHMEIVADVNNQFGEPIVQSLTNRGFTISPSDELIQTYQNTADGKLYGFVQSETPVESIDLDQLYQELGTNDINEFISKEMTEFSDQIARIRQINPNFTIEFSEENASQFDQTTNTILISPQELWEVSQRENLPYKQVVSILIMHEMGHAASAYALETGSHDIPLQKLFDQVFAHHQSVPFEDKLRQGYRDQYPYAFKNIHEFAAEAYGNPFFQEYLKSIPAEEGRTAWQKFIDTILEFLGMRRPSYYDVVLDYLNSEQISKANREGSEHPSTEWNMSVVYRGMPRGYSQAAFEMLTEPTVKNDIDKIMAKLPSAIVKIKTALDQETNKDKIKTLQRLLDSFNEVKGNEEVITVSINMLTQAAYIARDIDQQLVVLGNEKDLNKQLALGWGLLQQAKSLDFIRPLASETIQLILRQGETANVRGFVQSLRDIESVVSHANEFFINSTKPALIQILSDFVGVSEEEKRIRVEISQFEQDLKTALPGHTQLIEARLANAKARLATIPNKETFERIFMGLYQDASPTQLNFEAALMNGHPLVNTAAKVIRENNQETSKGMLDIANEHQRRLDTLKKAVGKDQIRKTDEFYKPITDLATFVEKVEENPDGTIKYTYTTQKMLLSSYSPEYIKQSSEHNALVNYLFTQYAAANRKNDKQNAQQYKFRYEMARNERKRFQRENAQSKFTDEVIAMYDLLDMELITPQGERTTFLEARGHIFEEIEAAERARNEEPNPQVVDKIQEEITDLYIKLKNLRSKYNEDGSDKVGYELQLANIAQKYSEQKALYGDYELTPQGLATFERAVLELQQQRDRGFITPEDYDKRISEITVTEVSDRYYDRMKEISAKIDTLVEQIVQIPEFKPLFSGVERDKIRQGYDKIKELAKPFRDHDLTIDGVLFSKLRPELVKEIKTIQEQTEQLRVISDNLRGLSIEDSKKMRNLLRLKKKGSLLQSDLEELEQLQAKFKQRRELYQANKELLNKYSNALKEMGDLNESTTTHYYDEEVDAQRSILRNQKLPALLQEAETKQTLKGGTFKKFKSGWHRVGARTATETQWIKVDTTGYLSDNEAVANIIANEEVDAQMLQSEWWINHHYKKNVYNKKTRSYEEIDAPLYIWVKTEPKDKTYISYKQPSIKFKTYKVKPEFQNAEYDTMNDLIPLPKPGRFVNDRYAQLQNSTDPKDKAYFEYLEFSRKSYKQAQAYYPDNKKMGDILPSFVKTGDEVKVETTEAIKGRTAKLMAGNLSLGFGATADTDEQVLTGGSTTNFFAKNRIIPARFANKMKSEKQSSDIPAMLLGFNMAAMEYNKMNEDQPMLEAMRLHVENLDVQQTKALASKFSMGNLFAAIKSGKKSEKRISTKDTDKSVLSKSMDHVLDTFLYGETKQAANIDIQGMDFDLNKASSQLKRFSSTSIFMFNMFSAVKNSFSAIIQGNLNSNIGKGFFTKKQYNVSHGEAIRLTKDYLADYKRFGNKTKIGQEMDLFQVLQGAAYNSYGQKTAWTVLKNSTDALTAFKNASEFELQVSQYLAMSKANPIQLANGEWVEFRKAFEINPAGDLVPVAGAKISEKEIKSFMHKLAYVNRVINGAYRAEEKNLLQKNILGDLAFYLNGYLIPGIVNRFGRTRYSTEADMTIRGYHNQAFAFIKDCLKYYKEMPKVWQTLNADERHRVLRSANEILTIIGMAVLTIALGSGDDKEELKKNNALHNWALAVALGVKSETETFVPFPGFGLNEMARKMNSPFAALRQISNTVKVLENLSLFMINDEDAFYKQTSVKDGFHDKGDPKFIANFLKLVGYSGVGFDPVEKVLQVEKAQQLR